MYIPELICSDKIEIPRVPCFYCVFLHSHISGIPPLIEDRWHQSLKKMMTVSKFFVSEFVLMEIGIVIAITRQNISII